MPLQLVRNDITKMQVDAIVNAAKPSLLGGGGVDGAIHQAAGPELLEACRALGGCPVGEARITAGYGLPCRYVIHTVGPRWKGGLFGEDRQLASCYRSALELAAAKGCETVAFPLISAGNYGYPKDKAMRVALDSIGAFLLAHEMTVYLVLFGRESVDIGHKLFADIREYIEDREAEERRAADRRRRWNTYGESMTLGSMPCARPDMDSAPAPTASFKAAKARPAGAARPSAIEDTTVSLGKLFDELDESFQQMLLRKIDESGMTDAQCYKRANIDRKLFSKIRGDVHYRPSKPTVIAFAIALELDLRETEELLRKAGFALSRSSRFDIIIRYFIERGIYDIFQINEVLFYYDQSLLG